MNTYQLMQGKSKCFLVTNFDTNKCFSSAQFDVSELLGAWKDDDNDDDHDYDDDYDADNSDVKYLGTAGCV